MDCFLMREPAKITISSDMKTRYWVEALVTDVARAHTEGPARMEGPPAPTG